MVPIDEFAYVQDDNVRNLQILGVPVLSLDKTDDLDLSATTAVFETPVPVFEENMEGQLMGAAHLYLEDRRVVADIFIDYASPLRLDIQAGKPVYPLAAAVVSGVANDVITGVRIDALVLTTKKTVSTAVDLNDYVENPE